jgi:hypothetical protein
MVHDQLDVIQGPATLDQIAVRFDEQRLVSWPRQHDFIRALARTRALPVCA